MKKIGLMIFAAALVIGLVVANMFSFGRSAGHFFQFSMNFGGVHGSGNVTKENRGLSGFKSIDVGGIYQVEITGQKDFAVEVEADDNLLPLITTTVEDGVLRIETEGKISPTTQVRIRIAAPDIDKLDVSGVANVTLNDIKNNNLLVDASGASKIKIAGETRDLTIDVSGATKIDAESLSTENATVDASGASGVTVNVSGDLKADASGASKILYTGSPANVEKSSHGASRVSEK
ncbi:head GIN domain-containing protein [soil metagenome]